MILPTKHISFDRSLLLLGGSVIEQLEGPLTVTRLWADTRERTAVRSFDEFALALSFLFAIGAVELQGGLVVRQG